MTSSIHERVTVEAYYTPSTTPGFHLDTDRLGSGRLAASAESWWPITAQALSVSIARGGSVDEAAFEPQVGTLTIVLKDPADVPWRPSTPIRATADGHRLFTGRVENVHTAIVRKGDPYEIVTITAVDALQQLANTPRYGAVVSTDFEWDTYESITDRYARLLNPTGLPWEGAPEVITSAWVDTYGLSAGTAFTDENTVAPATETTPVLSSFRFRPSTNYGTNPAYCTANASRLWPAIPDRATMTVTVAVKPTSGPAGLPPKRWKLELSLSDHNVEADLPPDEWSLMTLTLTTAPTLRTLRVQPVGAWIAPAGTAAAMPGVVVAGWTITVGAVDAAVPVASIVYESTLRNHLDLASATAGGAWWIDPYGTVQVRAGRDPDETPVAAFSDATAPSYVALDLSYDTKTMITGIQLDNHGRQEDDTEPGNYIADDETLGPFTADETIMATFGYRSATVGTSIEHKAHESLSPWPARVAAGYLGNRTDPSPAPQQLRVWRDPAGPSLPDIDVMDLVAITRAGSAYACRVVGIVHTITPHHWHTDYTLTESA